MFFFQAEDGIRDAQESRGLGDVYKRQLLKQALNGIRLAASVSVRLVVWTWKRARRFLSPTLSLIHI